MSQPTGEHYAEIDLDEVDHGAYSQTCFLVQVDATFPNRGNLNTYATLLVQTPIAANQFGGITLLVNSAGAWQLEQVTSALTMPMLASGTAILTSPTAVLAVQVCHLELNAMVNNKIVATIADSLNGSSSVIGLLVEQQGAPSSPVVYSSFKLEQAT